MKLLVDTDAFCKLAVCGLLEDAVDLLGANLVECGRLNALPHMLRRGRLRKRYGAAACDQLAPIAVKLPEIARPGSDWLECLAQFDKIDPGETLIFAAAAEQGLMVLSGDKQALSALKNVTGLHTLLTGRIAVLEAVLIGLCDRLGPQEVRRRVQLLTAIDQVLGICFSDPVSDPRNCLRSYFEHIAVEAAPLVLWSPGSGGGG